MPSYIKVERGFDLSKVNKSSIVFFFLKDTLTSAFIFLLVFSIAIGLSEIIYFIGNMFKHSEYVIIAAKAVKGIMLITDVGLLSVFILKQALEAGKIIWNDFEE